MKQRYFVVMIVIALALSACGGPAQPAVLRIGWAGSPDTLNPAMGQLSESYTIYSLVYDSMYQYNMDGTYSLELAKSAEVSDDGLTWTFKLRDNAQWHDGQALTAKDVAFTYNFYASHEEFPFMSAYTNYFESVTAPDDQTVVIKLTEAIPNLESQLIYMYILPEHIWKSLDKPADFDNAAMIGSGPFKLVQYKQNEFIQLAKVSNHYLYKPSIDQVIFQTFQNDDALVQAIKTGQVDLLSEIQPTTVKTLQGTPNVVVVAGAPAAPDITDIVINELDPSNCPAGSPCTGHPALRDRNVRLALAMATDKKKIIDVTMLGYADPGLTLIPKGMDPFYNDQIKDFEYNPDAANQVLDTFAYLDTNGDGIREMPDGRPLTFRMSYPTDSLTAPRMAELLKEMWKEIGIGVEIQPVDADTLTSICCPAFDYDIILWGWGADPDPNFLLSVHLATEIETGMNETGYANPEYVALYSKQAVERDIKKRIETVWKMQQMLHDDVVYIIPYYAQAIQAYRSDRFTGWITDQGKISLDDLTSLVAIKPVR